MLTFLSVADHRLFVSQETLDIWMTDGRVDVEGEVMTLLPDRQRFQLKTALHFLEEVAGGGDDAELIGKVKDVEVLLEMGGEHVADSVILNDSAYQVTEGFLGEPYLGYRKRVNRYLPSFRALADRKTYFFDSEMFLHNNAHWNILATLSAYGLVYAFRWALEAL